MTFFSDEIRCPIHGDDLAAAVAMLAERTDVIGPLHVAGPEAMSRIDIAREVATWMGYGIDSLRESAVAESGQTRPACVILDSTRAAALGVQVRPLAVALRS